MVVLPNSFLAKLGLTNISRPDETHWQTLIVRVAPTRMPSIILDVMRSVLLSCNSIAKEPPPIVALKGLDATALEIELQFRASVNGGEIWECRAVDNHVYDRVRHFLVRRHKVPSRGTRRYPDGVVFGDLGVLRLRRVHLGALPCASR